MNNISNKQDNKNMQIPLRVFAAGIILSCTIFLLLLDNVKMYRSTISILVTTKSQIATEQKDVILYNIAQFPKMLSFYDKLLRENPDVIDATGGFSADKRKELWNNSIEVKEKNSNTGSIIELSVISKKQSDADKLSRKTAQTLFSVVSGYYNVKDDVDVRIVDGPIPSVVITGWFWVAILSLLLGSALAWGLQKVFGLGKYVISTKREQLDSFNSSLLGVGKSFLKPKTKPIASLEELYLAEDQENIQIGAPSAKQMDEAMAKTDQEDEKAQVDDFMDQRMREQYPNFPEMPTTHEAKDSAPDNLPIAEDFYAAEQQSAQPENLPTVEEPEIIEEPQINTPQTHEPTAEELKYRLNKLLKGEIKS